MIHWFKPDLFLPPDGAKVWVLTQHKEDVASVEISCGWVCYHPDPKYDEVRVENNDEQGHGSICWILRQNENEYSYHEQADAWAFVKDINLPEWMEFKNR